MSATILNFINGEAVQSRSGRASPVFNPATGQQSGTLGLASAEDVRAAVATARGAFPAWAATPPLRRAQILNRFLRILEERIDELASAITDERAAAFEG
ncbi:aldehyde dehydrogenase family protein [Bradyrhizobium sp. 186]|nr:aldehyde dehydrogenase family protein [Bradyrhizobium sp. 186]